MSLLKRPFRVSIWYPDDDTTNLANEKIVAFYISDDHDELRIGLDYRAIAWYFDSAERADNFADTVRAELKQFKQFSITQP